MANRLGFAHVDDLLDELSPEEFNERFAHYLLSGEGLDRINFATLLAEFRNLGTRIVAATTGANPPASAYEIPDKFLAAIFRPPRAKAKPAGGDPAEELARRLGAI